MSILDERRRAPVRLDMFEPILRQVGEVAKVRAKAREWIALLAMVVAADLLIFRGGGFLGLAVFFGVAPMLVAVGARVRQFQWSIVFLSLLIAVLCARLAWQGSALQVLCGVMLVAAFATSLAGITPHLAMIGLTVAQCSVAGAQFITGYVMGYQGSKGRVDGLALFKILLPMIVVAAFGTIFILANPDAVTVVYRQLTNFFDQLGRFIAEIDLSITEVLFWFFTVWISVGLFRPLSFLKSLRLEAVDDGTAKPAESGYFSAFRNTLWAVIVLFAVYLVVEFATLWFRDFPKDFYYAGYAHQGAAWLTIALALATAVLSVVFNRQTQLDPRAKRLRVLAYAWSFENLLLSIAVYNRLFIYIGYNGMTHMRIVGIFGISVVVIGFALVIWKIIREKSFMWLVHRQLWALALAVFLFAVTPVDSIAVNYNVRRILQGDIAACMQIGVQELDTESKSSLIGLLDCQDETIRTGVAAILAEEVTDLRASKKSKAGGDWKSIQISDTWLALKLMQHKLTIEPYLQDDSLRRQAIRKFYDYAYQWY